MKKNNKNLIFLSIGILAILISLIFIGNFAVIDKLLTESQKTTIMQKYQSQGYLCAIDSGNQIKWTNCEAYHWTTGVNAGTWQIDCYNYDWVTCNDNVIQPSYVYCLVNNNCIAVTGNTCVAGVKYSTAAKCALAKDAQMVCNIPTNPTNLQCMKLQTDMFAAKNSCLTSDINSCFARIGTTTTISGVSTTTSLVTTTTIKSLCESKPLDPSCYSCNAKQEVKNGACTTTFHSWLIWLRNWIIGVFS